MYPMATWTESARAVTISLSDTARTIKTTSSIISDSLRRSPGARYRHHADGNSDGGTGNQHLHRTAHACRPFGGTAALEDLRRVSGRLGPEVQTPSFGCFSELLVRRHHHLESGDDRRRPTQIMAWHRPPGLCGFSLLHVEIRR